MISLPETLKDAIDCFSQLPGVGEKTATRQSLIIGQWRKDEIIKFGEAIKSLADLKHCSECGVFSDSAICQICRNEERKQGKVLCVIESFTDCLAIERSGQYSGLYHILGGVLNPLLGIGPDEIHLDHLFERIKKLSIQEVILAVNPSVEGDATCSYIRQHIPDNVNVLRIGFGVPMGGSLEYLDPLTISKALENRTSLI